MLERLLDSLNLRDEDEEYYDDDEFDYEEEPSFFNKNHQKEERTTVVERKSAKSAPEREKASSRNSSKFTPMRGGKGRSESVEICVIRPTNYEDSREICETLLEDRIVFLNMRGLDREIAQKIIDFTCGACFAIQGNLQKVDDYIFVVTPSGVELSGDLANIVDTLDFSGLQTGF